MCCAVNRHRPPAAILPSATRLLNEHFCLLTLSVAKCQRTRRRRHRGCLLCFLTFDKRRGKRNVRLSATRSSVSEALAVPACSSLSQTGETKSMPCELAVGVRRCACRVVGSGTIARRRLNGNRGREDSRAGKHTKEWDERFTAASGEG